jgi:DNA uptake protein ComE-like DNA-binding protein
MSRYLWFLFVLLVVLLAFRHFESRKAAGVAPGSTAYEAACQGPPLPNIEARAKALRDGYAIHPSFDCIEKASFEAVTRQKAEEAAARTPEAIARRKAEREQRIAEEQRQADARERQRLEETAHSAPPNGSVRLVDINTGTQSELADIVGSATAARILDERQKRPFSSWPDVVSRVVGLSAAQSAAQASLGGLTVSGQSLPGAAPKAVTAN